MTKSAGNEAPHLPVLLQEVVTGLAVVPGETLVDGTFGAGGYTRALLGAGAGRVIGFDRDPDAIANGPALVPDERLTLINERFSQMDRVLAERGGRPGHGALPRHIGLGRQRAAGVTGPRRGERDAPTAARRNGR